MSEPRERRLSDLEGAALGHVWAHGPCTAHAVRTAFQQSPSTHWSGSAGAVYPLLDRLARRGLVRARSVPWGKRERRLLSVTQRGRNGLARWLRRGAGREGAAAVFDGLRTRCLFLGVLDEDERREFVRSSRGALETHLAVIEEHLEGLREEGDRFAVLGGRGAWLAARARLTWIDEVEKEL